MKGVHFFSGRSLLAAAADPVVLVVSHAYRKDEATIRIISARKATRLEQAQYWKRWER